MGPVIQIFFIQTQSASLLFPHHPFEWTDKASRNSKEVIKGKGGKKPDCDER